jgi:hypothetical protein
MEKEKHLMELLKIFSQGDEHKETVELESPAGGEDNSIGMSQIFS